jgi:hypothetical protein
MTEGRWERGTDPVAVHAREGSEGTRRARAGIALAAALIVALAAPPGLRAQMPRLPVLQNGLVGPGFAIAINGGSGGGERALAGALSWAPSNARFQIAAGGGVFDVPTGDRWPGYGARVAVPIRRFASGTVGVSAFLGIGGGRHDTTSVVHVPVGAAVGWVHSLGATRSISLYAAPFYSWARASISGHASTRRNAARLSLGADVALMPKVGLTLGYDLGGSQGIPGVSDAGAILGAGLSYAFR